MVKLDNMPITKLGMKFNGKKRKPKQIYIKNYFLSLSVLRYKKELRFDKETLKYQEIEVDELVKKVVVINVREKKILDFEPEVMFFEGKEINVVILKFDNFQSEILNMSVDEFIGTTLPEYEFLLSQE
jgi:hypothetical protein